MSAGDYEILLHFKPKNQYQHFLKECFIEDMLNLLHKTKFVFEMMKG
jgi:hypothetical protein